LNLYDTQRLRQAILGPDADSGKFRDPPAFVKFLIVGGLAFVVNQLGLYLLYDSPAAAILPDKDTRIDFGLFSHPDARLLIASALAVEAAIVFKFAWSERWIFRERRTEGGVPRRFVHFNVSCAASATLTVAVTNILTPALDVSPYIATAVGVLAGFMLNWVWAARLVWPERRTESA
jgi:putative flippase GtrA